MRKAQGAELFWKDWTAALSKIEKYIKHRRVRLLPVSRRFAGWPVFLKLW